MLSYRRPPAWPRNLKFRHAWDQQKDKYAPDTFKSREKGKSYINGKGIIQTRRHL